MQEITDGKARAAPGWGRMTIPLAASLLAFAGGPACATEPFSLAAHRLGLAYEVVLNDSGYDCESLAGCFLYSVCRLRAEARLDSVPLVQMSLYFQGERLSGVEAFFYSDRFEEVKAALESLHGPADGSTGPDVALWQQGSQVLRMERLARPQRASVVLSERSFLSELLKTQPPP